MSELSIVRGAGRLAAVTLLALAVLATSIGLKAVAAPGPEVEKKAEPKKDEPKKDEPKKDEPKKEPGVEQPAFPNFPPAFPPGADAETMRKMQANMRKMMEQMQRMRPGGAPGIAFAPFGFGEETRLGVQAEKPSAALAEQLDLPKGQGLVVEQVTADSAAAKAGMKANDILLELDGKPVPNELADFQKQLEGIKADTPVDVMVLRKGKKETLKGLSLPEAKANAPFGGINIQVPNFQIPNVQLPAFPAVPALPAAPAFPNPLPGLGGPNVVMTTTFRTEDRFTTRHQEGSLVITVTGTVADGKSKVGEIHVQDGTTTNKYESLDKVPDQYRDKVKNLIEMSEKSNVKIEIKNP
jgi:membrane-associated protease RseP (regulator of RpoE activity)